MIRSIFLLSLFVAFTASANLMGFQEKDNCLQQSDFKTDVDVNTLDGTFSYLGHAHMWKCLEITLNDVTQEDIDIIKYRKNNYEKFPDLKWDQAIRKITFSRDIKDTLIWKKGNGETVVLGDDRKLIALGFKKHGESVLMVVTGADGDVPVAIQVSDDVNTNCLAVDVKKEAITFIEIFTFC